MCCDIDFRKKKVDVQYEREGEKKSLNLWYTFESFHSFAKQRVFCK